MKSIRYVLRYWFKTHNLALNDEECISLVESFIKNDKNYDLNLFLNYWTGKDQSMYLMTLIFMIVDFDIKRFNYILQSLHKYINPTYMNFSAFFILRTTVSLVKDIYEKYYERYYFNTISYLKDEEVVLLSEDKQYIYHLSKIYEKFQVSKSQLVLNNDYRLQINEIISKYEDQFVLACVKYYVKNDYSALIYHDGLLIQCIKDYKQFSKDLDFFRYNENSEYNSVYIKQRMQNKKEMLSLILPYLEQELDETNLLYDFALFYLDIISILDYDNIELNTKLVENTLFITDAGYFQRVLKLLKINNEQKVLDRLNYLKALKALKDLKEGDLKI